MHSIYYLRPADYISRTVLVVGSFASGSDLARQLASLNIDKYEPNSDKEGYTKVYVSCSTPPDTIDPWTPYITYLPLMDHIQEDGTIVLQDQRTVKRVDTIIFATGYNFSLPFCKFTDYPWSDRKFQVLDEVIQVEEREDGREREAGGMKGLSMDKLDQVMLFLEADQGKSIAFPALRECFNRYACSNRHCPSGREVADDRIPNRSFPTCRNPNPPHRSLVVRIPHSSRQYQTPSKPE